MSVSINRFFSSLGVIFPIFHWMPDIVKLILLGAGYFCVILELPPLSSHGTQLLVNSLVLLRLAFKFCWVEPEPSLILSYYSGNTFLSALLGALYIMIFLL